MCVVVFVIKEKEFSLENVFKVKINWRWKKLRSEKRSCERRAIQGKNKKKCML